MSQFESSTTVSAMAAPQPPCPECAVALDPVGTGRRNYWMCRYCGTTLPRS